MKSEILNRCIRGFTLAFLLIFIGTKVFANEQRPMSDTAADSVASEIKKLDKNTINKRLEALNRQSIRAEFGHLQDINQEVMQAFPYFSALTVAFIKRLRLKGVDRFSGEEDVWRIYLGGGTAAHTYFPEYFRLKREMFRREMNLPQDDIQYMELSEAFREADKKFQDTVASHRREGLNPEYTKMWNHSTLTNIQKYILTLDEDAADVFSREFFGGKYHADFSKVEDIADAIIRQEERLWLFNELGLSDCLTHEKSCISRSDQVPHIMNQLVQLSSDAVLQHYFPSLIEDICDIKDKHCSHLHVETALNGIKAGMKEDQLLTRRMAIGVFLRFGWDGETIQIPLTRLLASFDNKILREYYRGLLSLRVFWRFIDNEQSVQ